MALTFNKNFIDTLYYNNSSVHTLYFDGRWVAGIHSNPMFFGGTTDGVWQVSNIINVFNVTGTVLRIDERSNATGRFGVGGAALKNVGMFYGGQALLDTRYHLTRLNKSGTTISEDLNPGAGPESISGGSIGAIAIFRGGGVLDGSNTIRRFNSSGSLVGDVTTAGSVCRGSGSASFSDLVLYYGGYLEDHYHQNKALKINSEGTIVGDEVTIGDEASRWLGGGGVTQSNGLFYGGTLPIGDIQTNVVRIINVNSLTTVGSDKGIGTGRMGMGSSTFDDFSTKGVMFYGGATHGEIEGNKSVVNTLLRVSAQGSQLGDTSYVGISRWGLAGACV